MQALWLLCFVGLLKMVCIALLLWEQWHKAHGWRQQMQADREKFMARERARRRQEWPGELDELHRDF